MAISQRNKYWIALFFCSVLLFSVFRNFSQTVHKDEDLVSDASLHSCVKRYGNYLSTHIQLFDARDLKKPYNVNGIILGSGVYNLSSQHGKGNNLTWSQFGQDLYFDEVFNKKRNGFFVEIGGYDGEAFSNTLFFEKERGWSGLLVEASPFMSQFMFNKNRKCYMINACVSNNVPCMSFVLAGAITAARETLTIQHKKRIHNEAKAYGGKHPHWNRREETVDVQCFSLFSLLKTLNRTHVDYFSLDVEGAELFILNSIDWNKIDIEWFSIETDQHRDEILTFMKDHGYEWVTHLPVGMFGDDIFKKRR